MFFTILSVLIKCIVKNQSLLWNKDIYMAYLIILVYYFNLIYMYLYIGYNIVN